jgi:lipoate synthase
MEVHKWLGQDSLTMLAIGENKTKISSDLEDFKRNKIQLLIISYTQALRFAPIARVM